MAPRADHLKSELVDNVAKIIHAKLHDDAAATADAFARHLYANVPPLDIATLNAESLYGAALSFLHFGRTRTAGQPKVRLINPRLEEHGWRSRHSVIEIVTEDMPFLVDSVTAELNRRGLTVHLVIHPIFATARTAAGEVSAIRPARLNGAGGEPDSDDTITESFMHFEVDEQTSTDLLNEIRDSLVAVIGDVRAAVEDWPAMRTRAEDLVAGLSKRLERFPEAQVAEACAFVKWILDDHFTFLGYREYDYAGRGDSQRLKLVPGGLGILRQAERQVFETWHDGEPLPPALQTFVHQPVHLHINKGSDRSTVHRRVLLDVIGIKKFSADGGVVGEQLIVGLFTSAAYSRSPMEIPLLRQKLQHAMQRANFAPASHDHKALAHILETYPRDELLQIDQEGLFENAIGILHLQERQRVALFVRPDSFERSVSALVYVPRERYNTDVRRRMAGILEGAFNGTVVAFTPQLATDSVLAQILFLVKTQPGQLPKYRTEDIEKGLVEATRSWGDKLRDVLVDSKGEETGLRLFARYGNAFNPGFRHRYVPEAAVLDIDTIEGVLETAELGMNLYRPIEAVDEEVRLKLYQAREPLPLSDVLPILENMGLKVIGENQFEVAAEAGTTWVHDFEMFNRSGETVDLGAVKDKFHATLARIFRGEVEDDGFNKLVLRAGLDWRGVVILRAYCKFLRQSQIPFSQSYMEQTLEANPHIARHIVDLFAARFDPTRRKAADNRADALVTIIETELEDVANLDEDRILRHFVNVVLATLRTNFYQSAADGGPKSYLALKLNSRAIDELPEPRPLVEIFVYGPRMEGCHLRGGKVARGGIRWSDRREDFRTEVLGLVKAQMVKNAVIVPVGSKGGFVCKRLPQPGAGGVDRQALMDEVVGCYSTLMRGMLDMTDNLQGGDVVPPEHVVRHDGDDPYLVVAADKGTATFSDIANGISQEYGFWLGDAFASGGSAGYDHKKMGITARGAWESVKRHFREMGFDTQSQDFTVVGVGDMSGDVFGNGMLLSEHIKLVAAFNHLHIFVDPDPDPQKSLAERQRLFALPRSGWDDYDTKLIAKGGGVFDRRAKSIKVTPEIRALFGIEADAVTPNELLAALLRAEVDLLWFGGIGTYIKAADESHAETGDRANDAIRIDAEALRCKVVGEGANLGVTQRGRVGFAQAGGRMNTDFIDNSAGVDCSDHEVNIKIVLDDVVANGDMTNKQRNELLEAMTEEVAALVLNDNYLQSQAINNACLRAPDRLEQDWRAMRALEKSDRLDRAIEFLPDDEDMAERQAAGRGLTAPEYAVLFSYAKLALYDGLLPTDVPDDPYFVSDLARYFPQPLRDRYAPPLGRHRLRREIIATYLTNSIVNRVGATFIDEMRTQTGMDGPDVARAYVVARDAFGLRPLWRAIEALDNKVAADVQAAMNFELERLVNRCTAWFLRNGPSPLTISVAIETYGQGVQDLVTCLPEIVAPDDRSAIDEHAARLIARGVPDELAQRVAQLDVLFAACDVVAIANGDAVSVADAGHIYFALGARLGIDSLRHAARRVKVETEWQRLAVSSLIDDSFSHQSVLTTRVVEAAGAGKLGGRAANGIVDTWLQGRRAAIDRTVALIEEIRAAPEADLAMLTVGSSQLRTLVAG